MADVSASDDTRKAEEAILRLRGVGKTYGSGELAVHALRDIDIEFHRSELLVLLGASGSGKSTLLNIVGGLDRPSRGSVLLDGLDLATADDTSLTRYRRDHVGFVFQFYNLVPGLTAAENVNLVTEIASDPMSTLEALALVDMEARAHHFPAQLSGASSNGSRLPGRSPRNRASCCATSRQAPSTARPAFWCWRPSIARTGNSARRRHSSPTMSRPPKWRIGSSP